MVQSPVRSGLDFSFFLERNKLASIMGRPRAVTDEQILVAARRCFLEHGAAVSAVDIAREVGVSHTTLFNRFGSKEGLMLAALGPPKEIPWVAALEAGPDDRPIREQLVEHAKVISAYFHDLQAGLGVLQAAGIQPRKAHRARRGEPPPVQALRALVGWLERAKGQGRLGDCDVDTLASTILGALHGWAFTARVCGESTSTAASQRYVERFIELLWNGIGESVVRDRP
jgi:AcrR family transcriptional regulator